MLGYWNRPDAAVQIFVEREGKRWLRTGDIATIDEDGYVRIVDRSKDMIAVGGFKVFPSQVEEVLLGHPRSTERRVGKECVSPRRSRGSPLHYQTRLLPSRQTIQT